MELQYVHHVYKNLTIASVKTEKTVAQIIILMAMSTQAFIKIILSSIRSLSIYTYPTIIQVDISPDTIQKICNNTKKSLKDIEYLHSCDIVI